MQKITPFLWFDGKAEEAMNFYLSVFKDSKLVGIKHYGEAGPLPKGTVLTVTFELFGQEFTILNGGPHFNLTPAISFLVDCDSQAEVDNYWDKLLAGGKPMQCGWLTDKYGVTWQIVPRALRDMLDDPDDVKAARVARAMFKMIKLDIAELKRAYDGR
jgi:predicted 3-demethylubiquinone-9 3-methyltransferase (glyoxalase superfamily)